MWRSILTRFRTFYDVHAFRSSLTSLDALPQFALLGILAGTVTGLVILLFRGLIEFTLFLVLPEGPESFEMLSLMERALTPIAGALCIASYLFFFNSGQARVGVAHVLERLHRHQGHMTHRGFIVQFIAGSLALISGQTGGREGPAIHLGAAASSLLGQHLQLPNNSIRVLVGCGAAAAIGSSFNTPIAGVIFAMEVILMEYTIAGFMPVILASVTGTLVVQIFLGSASMFSVPSVGLSQWQEIPFVVVAGLLLGCLAAALVHGVRFVHRYAPKGMAVKITLAGATTAIIGLWIPEILGVGYDTVNFALAGQLGLLALTLIVFAKLVATLVAVAFGLPIGVIGPTLFIGATAGSILWQLSQSVGLSDTDPAFFALLGMGAMMGATLNAPLAALMAIMELTQNSEIILPAMLCIVIATITAVHGLKMPSLFSLQLQLQGIQISTTPMRQALSRVGIETLSNPNFDTVPQLIAREDLMSILAREVDWLLIESEDLSDRLISASAARDHLSTDQSAIIDFSGPLEGLLSAAQVPWQATLDEAFDIIAEKNVELLVIYRPSAAGVRTPAGIVLASDINSHSWQSR